MSVDGKKKGSSSEDESLTSDFSEEEEPQSDHDNSKSSTSAAGKDNDKTIRNMPIPVKGLSNAMTRTIYTIIMLLAFIGIIVAGPFYCALLILVITSGIFREIINLKRKLQRENQIRHFIKVNWYFFCVGIFYFYGTFLEQQLSLEGEQLNASIAFVMRYHKFISFILWVGGFLAFVSSLQKGYLRYQFRLFGWTHLTIVIVVAQTSLIVVNLYKGIVWFILPALLVIVNDIFAYIFGKLFGKTKLIELSPNKTWEGFIGGFFSSIFFSLLFSHFFQMFPSLVCENNFMTIAPFSFSNCTMPAIFVPQPFFSVGGLFTISLSSFQMHTVVLSLFASLFAPFGGFFASGMKRALKVKDFGSSIPGHGGITDRMDCQFLMGTFTFFYISYVVFSNPDSKMIQTIVMLFKQLSKDTQQQLLNQLTSIFMENPLPPVGGAAQGNADL